ncbi:MAG: SDR family oxidoreductase [Burkholderiales bacterium]|nr:SDR family oxidoreductase [Burkholderiales bacterium]
MSTFFITGSTGVVGSALVAALLDRPDARLRLLIRAPSDEVLRERLAALLAFTGHGGTDAARRVEALRGDTTAPRLGLGEQDYARIAGECTHVIHVAGLVRMNLSIADARASAVTAARNMLDLVDRCADKESFAKAELVSTVGVGGRWPGELPERFLVEPRSYHNTYEQAKAEAEELMAGAAEHGAPITVHRPSMVIGDSRSGRVWSFQVFYHLAEFLSGRRTRGVQPPIDDATVDLIPADYVARAILWSAATPATRGRVLHLCSGPDGAVRLPMLRERVREKFRHAGVALPRIVTVSPGMLKGLARVAGPLLPPSSRRALATLPIFLDYLSERQAFGNRQTRALLAAAGIDLPRHDTFLEPVLDYYFAQKYRAPGAAG